MHVLFDHQIFRGQRYGGISLYISRLIEGINQQQGYSTQLTLPYFDNENLPPQPAGEDAARRWLWQAMPRKGRRVSNVFSLQSQLTNSYDVFHATYYDPYFLRGTRSRPWTVTYHDMIHESLGGRFPQIAADQRLIRAKRLLAGRASRLIAISAFTKQKMVDHYQIDPECIRVVAHGNPYEHRPLPQTPAPVDGPYLLFVGNRWLYKNFGPFLTAVAPLLRRYAIRLVCAGGGAFTADETAAIARCGVGNYVRYQPIRNEQLPALYRHAVAFAFPSLEEGFGFPILEAFACRCPCVVSDNSSFPEVAGPHGAVYFDPNRTESMTAAVERIIGYGAAERQALIDYGAERLARFTWDRTIRETTHVYEELVSRRG